MTYFEMLENIDAEVTFVGIDEAEWKLLVTDKAKKAGIPNELIKQYVDGDLVIVNGTPYDLNGNQLKF